jgi:hypothetical protein
LYGARCASRGGGISNRAVLSFIPGTAGPDAVRNAA